jgi:hypothetical protein
MDALRVDQRIRHEGAEWTVRQLYRADGQVLIEREGERKLVPPDGVRR